MPQSIKLSQRAENKRPHKQRSRLILHIVSFLELIHTAAGINELLFACKERVALVADIDLESVHILGGTRLEGFAACAYNRYFMIFRMYIGLHFLHLALDLNTHILYIIKTNTSTNLLRADKIFWLTHAFAPLRGRGNSNQFDFLVAFAANCEYNESIIMDNWILKNAGLLVNEPAKDRPVAEGQVKVKVSYVLASNYDAMLYSGEGGARYPKTIGRFAVGRITETCGECYGVEKNMRVLLKPSRSCGKCLNCRTGKEEKCASPAIAGKDFDGFLRDFVVCGSNEVAPLPDSVNDIDALCTEAVAIAEKVYDRLELPTGSRVAVIGGNFAGNILAQVLQYHKLVPIVIDNNSAALEKARGCGIYYSFEADENLQENIMEATSGQLCDASVYTTCSRLDPALTIRTIADGKLAMLAGFAPANFNIPARELCEKSATLSSIMSGYGYTSTAINLLVHKAVDTSVFEKDILTEYDPNAVYKTITDANNIRRGKMTIFKMII